MPLYPARALERAMKISEVITRAVSRKINWIQAAEILGMSDRQLRRWRNSWDKYGYGGLFDYRTQRPSPKRVPMAEVEKVLRLYREKYFDLNVKHFVEKLHSQEQIQLSYTWVKTALQNAGLVKRETKRGPHRRKRPRRPIPGMMLHVDGSRHRWIPGLDQYQDLIVVFDDATSEAYDVKLVDEESTVTVMGALKRVVEQRGLFCSLYSDRGSHMAWTPKAGGPVDRAHPTPIARALDQLGIELILAYSPQARGSVSDYSARGKDACRRSSDCATSARLKPPMIFSDTIGSRSTMPASAWRRNKPEPPLLPIREPTWRRSSPNSRSASWTTTTR
jgi:transposase